MIADCASAAADSLRLKGELDELRARLAAEVASAIKPGKAVATAAALATAWKRVEPLEKVPLRFSPPPSRTLPGHPRTSRAWQRALQLATWVCSSQG